MASRQSLVHLSWTSVLVCVLVMGRAVAEQTTLDTATVAGRVSADSERPPNPSLDEVKQLEDLKQPLVNQDGRYNDHVDKMAVQDVGGPGHVGSHASHVRAEVEGGVGQGQREVADNVVERRSPPDLANHLDSKYSSFSGVQYSPRDMAEYVFWTGDEKGVTLAIEEFLDDGLMTREEAITFLQEIKVNLDYLQLHYSKQQRFLKLQRGPEPGLSKDNAMAIQKALNSPRQNLPDSGYMTKKSVDAPVAPPPMRDEAGSAPGDVPQNLGLSQENYEELLERLKVADFLYTEYSLEEVIYQLAKVMFSQSLAKGSTDAQEALQKFTVFLASEADKGHISRGLEKKVLDVLIASLADTLAEHPRLSPTVEGSSLNANNDAATSSPNQLLHQLLMLHPAAGQARAPPGASNGNGNGIGNGKGNKAMEQSTHHASGGAKGRDERDSGNKGTLEQVRKEKM